MSNDTVRYLGVGPSTEFYPCSAALASSPTIIITATSATGGGTAVHVADANAYDVLYVTAANNSGSTLVAYQQVGTTATTQTLPVSLNSNTTQVIANGNIYLSGGGTYGIWTTATTGITVTAYYARTFTASSS